MRFLGTALAMLPLVAASSPATATVQFSEAVQTADGVLLATRVYLPDESGGKWPTLLIRSPYPTQGNDLLVQGLDLIAALGYAAVVQDTRGTGESGGEPQPFLTDRADGLETLAWLLAQPWTDGRVLMGGGSALGIPAYLMAPGADPAMQCQLIAIATPDVYSQAAFQGGVMREGDVKSWTAWLGLQALVPELLTHRDCDAFWDPARVTGLGPEVRASAVHVGGWYDLFVQGALDGFDMYRKSADPFVAAHQYLIVGPWHHHGIGKTEVGELKLPDTATLDLFATGLGWIQWCFDGSSEVVDGWPPVQYWVMGAVGEEGAPGNEWRSASSWPPGPTQETPLYLSPEGRLGTDVPQSDFERAFPFDPKDPSPTVGGRNLSGSYGPADQSQKVESRPDAVTFTTGPLSEPLEVTGRVRASLWVAADAADADVAVRMTDVYPDGRSILIIDGIVRLSRREGCEHATAVVPGEPVAVDIDLWSTSWIFNSGHRVRIVVTGSNHPRFELNPAIAAPAEGEPKPVLLRVFGGPARPSALWVPVPLPGGPDAEPGPEETGGTDGGGEAVTEPAVETGPEPVAEVGPADVPQQPEAAEFGAGDEASGTTETVADVLESGDAHADREGETGGEEGELGVEADADPSADEAVNPPPTGSGGCTSSPGASVWAVLIVVLAGLGLSGVRIGKWLTGNRKPGMKNLQCRIGECPVGSTNPGLDDH